MFGCSIITHEPLDRFASDFDRGTEYLASFENSKLILLTSIGKLQVKLGTHASFDRKLIFAGYAADGKLIGITEPRRVAATAMSTRVALELGIIIL